MCYYQREGDFFQSFNKRREKQNVGSKWTPVDPPPHALSSPGRLPNQAMLFRHNIAHLGNMNLSNCVEFDNLTLNCSMGTVLSKARYFSFAQLFDTIFKQLSPGGKNIALAERF